jgi:hypothetical protein
MNQPAYNWAAEVMSYAMANPAGVARRKTPKASRPVRSAPATVQAATVEPVPEPLAVEAPAAMAEPIEAEPVPVPVEPVSQVRSIRPVPVKPSPSAKLSLSDASKAFTRTKWGTFEADLPEQWAQSVCRAKGKKLAVGFFAYDEPVRVSVAKLKTVLQCRKNWVSWAVEFRSHNNQQTLEIKWFNRYGGRGGMKLTDQPVAEFEAIAIGEADPEAEAIAA